MFYNKEMKGIKLFLLLILAGCSARSIGPTVPSGVPLENVGEITASATTSSPLAATAIPAQLPLLIFEKGPYMVFTGDPDSLRILWQPMEEEVFFFHWGEDDAYSNGTIRPSLDYETGLYSVLLEDLSPGSRYFYRISTATQEVRGSFNTPAGKASTDLIFWVYGDTRTGVEVHDQISASILKQIAQEPAWQTFVVCLGDLMNTADEDSLQQNEFDPTQTHTRKLKTLMPLVNIMGNHDGTALFKKYFPYPYTPVNDWSFDYGPAHFTILNQYLELSQGTSRWEWLRNDLSSSDRPWKFILLHEPGWSAGFYENNETVQQVVHPLAVAYGVDMVMAGHSHFYSRAVVDGVTHLTSGGGGAPLYDPEGGWPAVVASKKAHHFIKIDINGDTLTATVLTPAGEPLDEFTIQNQEEK